MLLCIVIPVFNEEATLPLVIKRLDATPPPRLPESGELVQRKIVVVDDGSIDGTTKVVQALASRPDVVTVIHKKNMGKGAALRSGFAAAMEAGADAVLIQDGDLEYDPVDHDAVLKPLLDGRADAVIGSRFLGQAHRVMYYWHWIANTFITQMCNMFTNLNLTDIECGVKVFSRRVVERLQLKENRFGIEPELVAKVARMRLVDDAAPKPTAYGVSPTSGGERRVRVFEVPVSYAGRTYKEGKKIGWKDGVSALRCILKYSLLG